MELTIDQIIILLSIYSSKFKATKEKEANLAKLKALELIVVDGISIKTTASGDIMVQNIIKTTEC